MKIRSLESIEGMLTKGKTYEAKRVDNFYFVTDDSGRQGQWFYLERFEVVVEAAQQPMLLPSDPAVRKDLPITSGVLDYFPLAIAEVARLSKVGNDQHNPGEPLHWDKTKSTDHADCIPRHLIDRNARDTDGMRHSAKLAWRALALLETQLQAERDAVAA